MSATINKCCLRKPIVQQNHMGYFVVRCPDCFDADVVKPAKIIFSQGDLTIARDTKIEVNYWYMRGR